MCFIFFFSSRRRHTRCALVTGVQTCALPILPAPKQVAYRPVTWALQSDGAVGAEMARGDEPKLVVYAESGASGGVASKLMFLAPGRYRQIGRAACRESVCQ